MKVPCITLRGETEWLETVYHGWNQLDGWDSAKIVKALADCRIPPEQEAIYGGRESGR